MTADLDHAVVRGDQARHDADHGGVSGAEAAGPEVAASARVLAVRVDRRVVGAALDVEHELARPAAVNPECLDAADRRVDPLAQEDAGEPDLPTLAGPDPNDDLVE